jgi:hypothetical protein
MKEGYGFFHGKGNFGKTLKSGFLIKVTKRIKSLKNSTTCGDNLYGILSNGRVFKCGFFGQIHIHAVLGGC